MLIYAWRQYSRFRGQKQKHISEAGVDAVKRNRYNASLLRSGEVIVNLLVTEDLSKTYRGGVRALQGVSLEVSEGEIFGLVGPNGAGKTTFVKVLLGLIRATGGRAQLLGRQVRVGVCPPSVGYLPENIAPPGRFTGRFFLRLVGLASGMRSADLRSVAQEVADAVGAGRFVGRKISHMSRGMLQRVGLAAALVAKPKILFLDEPTSGLDPVARKNVRDLLLNLKNNGVTIFLNSHILSELEMVCDRVMLLERGRVLAEGKVEELTRRTGGVLVRTEPAVSEEDFEALRTEAGISFLKTEDALIADSFEEANRLIDGLRKRGYLIKEVTRRRERLEDVVLRLLSETENGRGSDDS